MSRRDLDRYRRLLDTLPVGLQECDSHGTITYSNPAHAATVGALPSEVVGRKIWDLLANPDEKEELRRYLGYLVAEKPPPTPYVTANRSPDGRVVDVEVDWDYILEDSGEVSGFPCLIRDITEERRRSLDRDLWTKSIMDSVPVFISYIDRDLRYRFVNRQYERAFGKDLDEIVGRSVEENIGVENFCKLAPHFAVTLAGAECRDEVTILLPTGPRRMQFRLVPHREAAREPVGFFCIAEDVTEVRESEERVRLLSDGLARFSRISSLGHMAAQIAHEVQQPLFAISALLFSIKGQLTGPDPRQTEVEQSIERIELEVHRTAQIVRRLRDQVSGAPRPCEVTEIKDLIRRVLQLQDSWLSREGVELELELSPLPMPALAEPIELSQLLVNVISNGAEAMAGLLRKQLRIEARPEQGGFEILVRDRGPGMVNVPGGGLPPPFTSTKPQGLGLGISICRTIIENHRGTLKFESPPDGGCLVRIWLPAAP